MKKICFYCTVLIVVFFSFCSAPAVRDVQLNSINKVCLDGFLDTTKIKVPNYFIVNDTLKMVKYKRIDDEIVFDIYTKYDCIVKDDLKGDISVKNDTILASLIAKPSELASSCICPSIVTYKLKVNKNKNNYIIQFKGLKYGY